MELESDIPRVFLSRMKPMYVRGTGNTFSFPIWLQASTRWWCAFLEGCFKRYRYIFKLERNCCRYNSSAGGMRERNQWENFDRIHQLEGLVAQRDRLYWNSWCTKWFTMKILSRSQLLLLAFFPITVSHVWSLGYPRTLRRAGSESQE